MRSRCASSGVTGSADTGAVGRLRLNRRFLLVALCLSFAVQVAVAFYVDRHDPDRRIDRDTWSYVNPAHALVEDHAFALQPSSPDAAFFRTPGYPVFIAAVFTVAGDRFFPVIVAQVLVHLATAWLVFLIARTMFSERVGVIAGVLVAFDPLQIAFAGTLMSETLATFTLTLAAYALLRLLVVPGTRRALALGVALGVAIHVRPVAYYLPVLLVPMAAVHIARRASWGLAIRSVGCILLPLVLLVGGWQLRNHRAVDSWRFAGVEGYNMLYYRAAAAVAAEDDVSLPTARESLERRLPPDAPPSEGVRIERMWRLGVRVLFEHPLGWIEMTVKAVGATVLGVGRETIARYLGTNDPPAPAIAAATLLLIAMYALAVSAFMGRWRAKRGRALDAAFVVIAAYMVLISAGAEAYSRFRVPVFPLVDVYVAAGLVAAVRARQNSRGQRLSGGSR